MNKFILSILFFITAVQLDAQIGHEIYYRPIKYVHPSLDVSFEKATNFDREDPWWVFTPGEGVPIYDDSGYTKVIGYSRKLNSFMVMDETEDGLMLVDRKSKTLPSYKNGIFNTNAKLLGWVKKEEVLMWMRPIKVKGQYSIAISKANIPQKYYVYQIKGDEYWLCKDSRLVEGSSTVLKLKKESLYTIENRNVWVPSKDITKEQPLQFVDSKTGKKQKIDSVGIFNFFIPIEPNKFLGLTNEKLIEAEDLNTTLCDKALLYDDFLELGTAKDICDLYGETTHGGKLDSLFKEYALMYNVELNKNISIAKLYTQIIGINKPFEEVFKYNLKTLKPVYIQNELKPIPKNLSSLLNSSDLKKRYGNRLINMTAVPDNIMNFEYQSSVYLKLDETTTATEVISLPKYSKTDLQKLNIIYIEYSELFEDATKLTEMFRAINRTIGKDKNDNEALNILYLSNGKHPIYGFDNSIFTEMAFKLRETTYGLPMPNINADWENVIQIVERKVNTANDINIFFYVTDNTIAMQENRPKELFESIPEVIYGFLKNKESKEAVWICSPAKAGQEPGVFDVDVKSRFLRRKKNVSYKSYTF